MKELAKIRYRSVISHNDEKVSDVFEGEAMMDWQLAGVLISFKHQQHGQMSIQANCNQLTLKHGTSILNMTLNKKVKNLYALPFGNVEIEAFLRRLDISKEHIAIVYYLYDRTQIISKCYCTIEVINTNVS